MNKLYIFIVIITLQSLFANADSNPTVKEQLENLNIGWKDKNFDDPILKERIFIKDEVALIQMHLSLVEQKLRDRNTDYLITEQKQNRNKSLGILHNYWIRGIFPKNIYHDKRTPYFIDDFGTACAVGQLIVSTGYGDFAKKISSENNYAYIKELYEKYPELKQWANKFGFSVDELAWIQPTYAVCDTSCNIQAIITAWGGITPYTYLWNPSGQTSMTATNLCPGTIYTCTVIDALGDTVTWDSCYISHNGGISLGNNFMMSLAPPIYSNSSSTNDNGSCNGTATVTVTSGTSPFGYYWQPGGQTTQTAINLCQGTYWVMVTDANNCMKMDSVMVNTFVGINEIKNEGAFILYPIPFTSEISITLPNQNIKQATISIKNILGQTVFLKEMKTPEQETKVDLSFLERGIYLVEVIIDGERTVKKIVKE